MTRYRSARIVPGVNPPAGIESDEISRLALGVSAGTRGDSAGEISSVGIMDGELMLCPQEPQNLLSDGFFAEQFGHWIIDGCVIGFVKSATDYMGLLKGNKACSVDTQ